MKRRAVYLVAAVTVVAATVAGLLAWQSYRGEQSGPVRLVGDDPRVHSFYGNFEFSTGLGRTLTVRYDQETRCLYVTDRDGVGRLAIWPRGSRPVTDDGRRGVRVPRTGTVLEGYAITNAGAYGGPISDPEQSWPPIAEALQDLDACIPDSNQFTVFYTISDFERDPE